MFTTENNDIPISMIEIQNSLTDRSPIRYPVQTASGTAL